MRGESKYAGSPLDMKNSFSAFAQGSTANVYFSIRPECKRQARNTTVIPVLNLVHFEILKIIVISVYTSTCMIDYCVGMYAVAHVWRISSLLPPFLRSIGYWAFVANAFTY